MNQIETSVWIASHITNTIPKTASLKWRETLIWHVQWQNHRPNTNHPPSTQENAVLLFAWHQYTPPSYSNQQAWRDDSGESKIALRWFPSIVLWYETALKMKWAYPCSRLQIRQSLHSSLGRGFQTLQAIDRQFCSPAINYCNIYPW